EISAIIKTARPVLVNDNQRMILVPSPFARLLGSGLRRNDARRRTGVPVQGALTPTLSQRERGKARALSQGERQKGVRAGSGVRSRVCGPRPCPWPPTGKTRP